MLARVQLAKQNLEQSFFIILCVKATWKGSAVQKSPPGALGHLPSCPQPIPTLHKNLIFTPKC